MSVLQDLHLHYVQACQNLSQPENPFIARVLQEANKNDDINTKGITLKLAGNNHLVPMPRVTDDDLGVLVSVLGQAAFVTGLDLAYNVLTDAGAKTMATFLQEKSTLRYLNLMFNDIGASGAELIAAALHRNKSLMHLRMTGNKIGNQGGMFFASMLKINSTLEKLDLGDCDVGLQCLIAIAIALTQNKSLKAINLNRPLLSNQQEETTVHIARMLRSNSSLLELHLGKHEMKNFGVEQLCEALYENSSLRYLDLSCNNITCDGVKFLGELLKRNQTLEILDLNANRIEDVGAIYLSEALLTWNRTLQALSIVSNNITGKGLVALAHTMQFNTQLSHIYIWGNKFDRSTCVELWVGWTVGMDGDARSLKSDLGTRGLLQRAWVQGHCLELPAAAWSRPEEFSELIEMGRLQLGCTDVAPYKVDGKVFLAELSHGLAKHRYWAPRCAAVAPGAANASLDIVAVSEYL